MTTLHAIEAKRVTIRDVAALAGVDASLVSRVLNDHPKASAGQATRQRIVEAARELGYHPNVAARSLRTAKTWTLGLLLPNLTNPMYAAIARAAERRAQERGYGLVFGTHVEGEDEATFARMLQQGRVEGLLTASSVLSDAFLRRIAIGALGPVVMLNRRVPGVWRVGNGRRRRRRRAGDPSSGRPRAQAGCWHLRTRPDRHDEPTPGGLRQGPRTSRNQRDSRRGYWA